MEGTGIIEYVRFVDLYFEFKTSYFCPCDMDESSLIETKERITTYKEDLLEAASDRKMSIDRMLKNLEIKADDILDMSLYNERHKNDKDKKERIKKNQEMIEKVRENRKCTTVPGLIDDIKRLALYPEAILINELAILAIDAQLDKIRNEQETKNIEQGTKIVTINTPEPQKLGDLEESGASVPGAEVDVQPSQGWGNNDGKGKV